jgi:hypothetical protein
VHCLVESWTECAALSGAGQRMLCQELSNMLVPAKAGLAGSALVAVCCRVTWKGLFLSWWDVPTVY